MTTIRGNDTFNLVMPPKGRKIVGGHWVFAVKVGPDGAEMHKAQHVAKGHSQTAGINYQETFALTACMSSVQLLMQQAVHFLSLSTPVLFGNVFSTLPDRPIGSNSEEGLCILYTTLKYQQVVTLTNIPSLEERHAKLYLKVWHNIKDNPNSLVCIPSVTHTN